MTLYGLSNERIYPWVNAGTMAAMLLVFCFGHIVHIRLWRGVVSKGTFRQWRSGVFKGVAPGKTLSLSGRPLFPRLSWPY